MSRVEFAAKFDSRCSRCNRKIRKGEPVVGNPPKGKRRRWIVQCDGCARSGGPVRDTGAWRKNREWMTAEEFAVVEEAMAKKVEPSARIPAVNPKRAAKVRQAQRHESRRIKSGRRAKHVW